MENNGFYDKAKKIFLIISIFASKIAWKFCWCMKKLIRLLGLLPLLSLFLSGCSVSKFIPEGSYLLDEVKIESDNKEVKSSEMSLYVRQTPNAKWFSLVKLPLYIYSASGLDSTRWINRVLRK